MLNRFKEFDFYRKIPKDLTETSLHGTVLSVCASIFMLTLFVAEFWAFLSPQTITNVIVDPNTDSLLRINFNITVFDLACEFATIDVIDVLGTRNDNITKNVNKWKIDEAGMRRAYQGRNVEQRDLLHDVGHDLPALLANGQHAVAVPEADFDNWLTNHEYTLANFYAPWCVWCQRLEPVWEAFAEKVEAEQLPVSIIKVCIPLLLMHPYTTLYLTIEYILCRLIAWKMLVYAARFSVSKPSLVSVYSKRVREFHPSIEMTVQ